MISIILLHFLVKYMVSGSDTNSLLYIPLLWGILVFMSMKSPAMVSTKAYYCAYVENLCPRLDPVLCLVWMDSVWFLVTEICTISLLSSKGCWIGACWLSYSWTGTAACSYDSVAFSVEARPWYDVEINVVDRSCCL